MSFRFEFQTNLIFYRWNIKQKHHFYRVTDTIKSDVFVLCFSIKDQICLKLVKCFCCYSASTKTSFGFFSCSELLRPKFGEQKNAGKWKLLSPQDSSRGDQGCKWKIFKLFFCEFHVLKELKWPKVRLK